MHTTTSHRLRRFAVASAVAVGSLIPLAGSAGASPDGPQQIAPSLRAATVSYSSLINQVTLKKPAGTGSSMISSPAGPLAYGYTTVVKTGAPLIAGRGCSNQDAFTAICWSVQSPHLSVEDF